MGCLFGSGGFRWRVVKEEVTMQGSLGLVVAAEGGYDGGVVMRRMEMMQILPLSRRLGTFIQSYPTMILLLPTSCLLRRVVNKFHLLPPSNIATRT